MEAYVQGVSTRGVDDLAKALGSDTGISKSEVSRICGDLDSELGVFRTRPLDHTRFPYVYLDATYCKARLATRSSRRPWSYPPASPRTADAKFSDSWSATARPRCSGASSCARCGSGG